jgi:hypothetical protein
LSYQNGDRNMDYYSFPENIPKLITNPVAGQAGMTKDGSMFRYTGANWEAIVGTPSDVLDLQNEEKYRLKSMYDSGIRHYINSGIRMTLRSDGTEYISKEDMPA